MRAALALLLALLPAPARAGNWFEELFYGMSCEIEALGGTPGRAIVDQAVATTATLHDAVAAVEDIGFPEARRVQEEDGKATVFLVRADNLFNAAHLPARVTDTTLTGTGCQGPYRWAPVDIMANRLAVVHRGRKALGWYYAVSVHGYGVHASTTTRFSAPWMLFGVNTAYAFLAPFLPAGETLGDRFSLRWDWVGGLSWTQKGLDARLGYVGSRGLYANLDEQKTALFLRGVLRRNTRLDEVMEVPLARAGLARLPWPEDWEEKIGRTRLFGQTLRWYALEEGTGGGTGTGTGTTFTETTDAAPAEDERVRAIDLRTIHLDQMGLLGGVLDLRLAGMVQPQVLLHEASVGLHSRGYQGFDRENRTYGAGIWAGMTRLPAASWYGVAPGPKLMVMASGTARVGNPYDDLQGYVVLHAAMNAAEVLDVHPYAVNAPQVFLEYVVH